MVSCGQKRDIIEKRVHNNRGGDAMDNKNIKPKKRLINASEISHVGGISNDAGGVDPKADENLMRLSGGP